METRQHQCLEDLQVDAWYVYVDRTLDEDKPFYVGKGNCERIRKRERNIHWQNIVDKHGWNLDKRQVILATKDEVFALEQEQIWVQKFRTFEDGSPGRWGANRTNGGECTSGMTGEKNWMYGRTGSRHPRFGTKHTEASIEKNRRSNTGTNHPSFKVPRTQDVKDRIRVSNSGENSNSTHLIWDDIHQIRKLYITGNWTHVALGKKYQVSRGTIAKIVHGQTWKDPTHEVNVSLVSKTNRRRSRLRDDNGRFRAWKAAT